MQVKKSGVAVNQQETNTLCVSFAFCVPFVLYTPIFIHLSMGTAPKKMLMIHFATKTLFAAAAFSSKKFMHEIIFDLHK